MNLTAAASLAKKILLPLAVLLLVIFLVSLIYWQFSNKNQAEVIPQQKIEQAELKNVKVKVDQFNVANLKKPNNLPKSIAVPQITKDQNFTDLSQQLAAKLGFTNKPLTLEDIAVGRKLVYQNESGYFSTFENGFSYNKFSKNQVSPQPKSTDDLKNESLNFLKGLGLNNQFSPQSKFIYFKTQGEFETIVKEPQNADRTAVNFFYEISGLKILNQVAASASFDKQNQLTGVSYYHLSLGTPTGNYPVTTFEDAVNSLQLGKGSLIEATPTYNTDSPLPQSFKNVEVDNAYLAYYLPSKDSKILQPVWVFEGKSQTADGEVQLTYAVPAIESQYYANP